MDSAIFSLEQISIAYQTVQGERTVLQDISFSLCQGQKIALYAPNGSGKTSLLRCITGLLPAKSGKIFFHGQELAKEKDFQKLRRKVGFVLQEAADQIFFPTVLEDIAFGPLNLGLDPQAAAKRAKDLLTTLGISELEDRPTHELSGGEKRLVALAGILAMEPEALLLDEPTTALDTASSGKLLEILSQLTTARITVSHDLLFLSKVAEQFYTIEQQKLVRMPKPVLHSHHHTHVGGEKAHSHDLAG
ncbi:MAG: energy-coupling factor ABC transporter ATP-binding protein [Desulfovibrio sp.]|nr:energy-coupling factor ABC transporter ATP-binding protein [Desulfovibrio sp.]